MSIVAEVLSSHGRTEGEELNIIIKNLTFKISKLKEEFKIIVENKYTKFLTQVSDSKNLMGKIQILLEEVENISSKIKFEIKVDLENSTGELKELSTSLEEANLTLHILSLLVNIDNKLNDSDHLLSQNQFTKVASYLNQINSSPLFKEDTKFELKILKLLKTEYTVRIETLKYKIDTKWKDTIIFDNQDGKCLLTINMDADLTFDKILQASHAINNLDMKIKQFSNNLYDNFISVIILNSTNLEFINMENKAALELTYKNTNDQDELDIINNLNKLFLFLSNCLNHEVVIDSKNTKFLSLVGKYISEAFCTLYIKQVLEKALPNKSSEMDKYNDIATETNNFQEALIGLGFFDHRNQSLWNYASNVDVHFANKLCQQTLLKARNIIKKDLHDSMEMEPPGIDLNITNATEVERNEVSESMATLSNSTLQFPKCVISKSAFELFELIEEILRDCGNSSELRAVRLYCTVRKIMDMYCGITPVHHKKLLDTLPQQAALFHNNCMYLAHRLLTLGPEYHTLLEKSLPGQTITFVDVSQKLRITGTHVFLNQMQSQRKQFIDILRDSSLSNLSKVQLEPNSEKSIRQCLRQLELLQRVWQNCLPDNIYNKAIGTLLNTLVEELIVRICLSEDISAENASELVVLLKTVIDRAPRVLMDADEVYLFVKRWRTLEELIYVLSANLQSIEDRWAHGKGPLAQEFSPEQVKQLVRALFQNTARRAALLDIIRH